MQHIGCYYYPPPPPNFKKHRNSSFQNLKIVIFFSSPKGATEAYLVSALLTQEPVIEFNIKSEMRKGSRGVSADRWSLRRYKFFISRSHL